MKNMLIFCLLLGIYNSIGQTINYLLPDFSKAKTIKGMKLVWQDEFNENGKPNPKFWKSEKGFVRIEELQEFL
jgi:hypothetical protein